MVGLVGNINLKSAQFASLDLVMTVWSFFQIKFSLVNF